MKTVTHQHHFIDEHLETTALQDKSQEDNNKLTERYKMNKLWGQTLQTPLTKLAGLLMDFGGNAIINEALYIL